MKKIRNSKGFTLVELLAVIVIIGILLAVSITAVVHFIDRAREEQKSNQEKTLTMAAQNYLQDNRGQLPKSIGETTVVPITVLKNNKYITEDIKNSKNQSCMTNSYVTAYKESKTKYVYKAYLYCGDEEAPTAETKVTPTIKIDFVDAEGNSIKNDSSVLEKVAEAKFIIEFTGGKKDGEKIAIDGYSYSILTKASGENGLKEVYSSGTLSANRSTDIVVNRDNNLKDYIDISGQTTVAIKATVRNVDGGINDKVEFIGSDNNQAEVIYHDRKAPTCVAGQTKGEPSENDWININSNGGERKITVSCKDGSGSGCVRSTFTRTWNSDTSTEFDTITIRDNAGNTNECRVRVNIDVGYPVISLDAYAKGSGDTSTGSSVLTGPKTTEGSTNGTARINSNQYSNLVNGYMNKGNFPNGVIYKVTIKDAIYLKNWKWEVNQKNIKSTTASNYETVSAIEEAKTGSCTGQKECSFNVALTAEGLRKGVLTVYDKAGNKTTYTIYANIDRTGPTKPTIVNSSNNAATGDWTKSNVTLTLGSTDALSGMGKYQYTYSSNPSGSGINANTQWATFATGYGTTSFTTNPWTNEINKKVYIRSCDVAGNCSSTNSTDVKIDRTAPTVPNPTGYKKNNSNNVTSGSGLSTINSNTWHKGWEVVTASGSTDSGAGGVYYLVSVTGAGTNATDEKQSYRNVNAEGTTTVSFKACDKLGNCSSPGSFVSKLDRTAPTKPTIVNSSGGNGNWTNQNVTLTLGSTDAMSGVGPYQYTYNSNGTGWKSLGNDNYLTSYTTTPWKDEMNRPVYIRVCDVVDNCSTSNSTNIKIDKTAPVVPGIYNPSGGNWTSSSFTLTVTSRDPKNSDGTASGIHGYQYTYSSGASSVGGDTYSQWYEEGVTSSETYYSEFSAARNQPVYWRTCDNAGNCSGRSQTDIKIDKSNPVCYVDYDDQYATTGVTVTVTCSDSGSGCRTDTHSRSGLKQNTDFYVYDEVGHMGTCTAYIDSYVSCSGCIESTVYSARGCEMFLGSDYHSWKSCLAADCGNKKVCNGFGGNTSQGCCYHNCNCKTYYY